MPRPKTLRNHFLAFSLAVVSAVLTACGPQKLVATPNLLIMEGPEKAFGNVAPDDRKAEMDVYYITDRSVDKEGPNGPVYGHGRASAVAFGLATISLSPNPTWDQLVAESTKRRGEGDYTLKLSRTKEIFRSPDRAAKMVTIDGRLQLSAEDEAAKTKLLQDVASTISGRLKAAGSNTADVYLFVHGFNNTFEDSVFRIAQIWHYMGRPGIAIAYSWPAGWGGLFGYAYDRESGEYTITHLKASIKAIAMCPEVKRVHIIAHSRGTDVAMTALRELHIECRAKGLETRDALKLEHIILAAPDMDMQVFAQRAAAEDMSSAARQLIVYYSTSDAAIDWARWLFNSNKRVGGLGLGDFSPRARANLAKLPDVQFIDCKVSGYSSSHDYVFAHPASMSDLILVLRDGRMPGADNGRPLLSPFPCLYELDNDYPNPKPVKKAPAKPEVSEPAAPAPASPATTDASSSPPSHP